MRTYKLNLYQTHVHTHTHTHTHTKPPLVMCCLFDHFKEHCRMLIRR